jgi:hypothetical protein
MKILIFLFLASIGVGLNAQDAMPNDNDFLEIKGVMVLQEEAWNEGDLEKFMEGYWHSDSLRFTSSGRTSMGWENTLDGYYKTYPNRDKMGQLKFEIFDLYGVSPNVAVLSGTYYLTRKEEDLSGFFTLIFRKIEGNWKIIADTTCAN